MHSSTLFSIPLLSTFALASPLARSTCKTSYNANYDNITTGPIALLDTAPSPYDGLALPGFFTVPPGLLDTITTHSPPNSIGFNLVGEVASDSVPTMSVQYTGSPFTSMTLSSVYMGCVLVNPLGAYEPQSCSVTAKGTKADGSTVSQSLTFTVPFPVPAADLPENQQEQTFGDEFAGLTSVTFNVDAAGVTPALTGVSFDNFVYDLYSSC